MKRFLMALAGLILNPAGLFSGLAREPRPAAHLVFLNGEIRTLGEAGTVETALELTTLGAARQLRLEQEIGSPEPGKRTGLIWFDRDPVTA